jgi:hypothetical protein
MTGRSTFNYSQMDFFLIELMRASPLKIQNLEFKIGCVWESAGYVIVSY